MIYADIIERMIQGVLRVRPEVSRAMLSMQADAAFPQLNRQVSEEFAGRENGRLVLRQTSTISLLFSGGIATENALPNTALRKYLPSDARLFIPPVVDGDLPIVFYYVDDLVDFNRSADRVGKWRVEVITSEIVAKLPANREDGPANASFSCLRAPEIPANPSLQYGGSDEMVSALIEAGIKFLLGLPAKAADA